jgi:hypothetical protein
MIGSVQANDAEIVHGEDRSARSAGGPIVHDLDLTPALVNKPRHSPAAHDQPSATQHASNEARDARAESVEDHGEIGHWLCDVEGPLNVVQHRGSVANHEH